MTERLSDEMALLLDEGEQRSDQTAARALLHARLAVSLSEGLARDASVNGHASDYDCALMAALLDGGATPAERDTLAARLGDDPAARAELAAALALVDDIDAAAETPPAALVARASEMFAPAPAVAAQAGGGWVQSLLAVSRWHPATKFGMAAAMMVLVATPIVVPMMRDGDGLLQKGQGDGPVGRGLGTANDARKEAPAVAPMAAPAPAVKKDGDGCEASDTPAVAGSERKAPSPERAKPTVNGAAVHSTPLPADPCGRKAPAQNIPANQKK